MRFAIDLLWVRVSKVGGSESFIRNLISGFMELDRYFEIILVVAQDNSESFKEYTKDKRISLLVCPVDSENVKQRILYQNFHLSHILQNKKIKRCLEPVYSIPFVGTKHIKYFSVIHDLQALHFPQYFSKLKRIWLKISWKHSVKCSEKIIAISEYTKNDIVSRLGADESKIQMIHNPVVVNEIEESISKEILTRYGVESEKYFFCVTSMLPHKNVNVLIDIMKKRKDDYKLLICGIGGDLEKEFKTQIFDAGLENKIIVTSYVTDEIRDALYQECKLFIFPSIFEGFGMPPVEALLKDKQVITTRCTSIPEVTLLEAIYVDDPLNPLEWNEKINFAVMNIEQSDNPIRKISKDTNPYKKDIVATKYFTLISGDI